jgi:hypothetical protein
MPREARSLVTPWQPTGSRQHLALACFNCRTQLFQDRFEAMTGDT